VTKPRQDAIGGAQALSDAELASVVGRAQQLTQERERVHSVAEVQQVAAELELAPQHVASALDELSREREVARLDERRRRERVRSAGLLAGAAIALLGFVAVASAWSAAGEVTAAADEVTQARARLDSALDRQARTIATLVAAAGGPGAGLTQEVPAARAARDLADREAEVATLVAAAARAMAAWPPAATPAAEQQRLSLSYELTGAENRSSVERARHQAASARWQAVSRTSTGRLALWFHLARRP
jgi:hypothetical protein